jgi:hypothetical protein
VFCFNDRWHSATLVPHRSSWPTRTHVFLFSTTYCLLNCIRFILEPHSFCFASGPAIGSSVLIKAKLEKQRFHGSFDLRPAEPARPWCPRCSMCLFDWRLLPLRPCCAPVQACLHHHRYVLLLMLCMPVQCSCCRCIWTGEAMRRM